MAVRQWLAALPVGSPVRCATLLLDGVHELNRLDIPDPQRLEILRLIDEVATSIPQALHEELLDVAAPACKNELRQADLAILLHQELALAYRSAAQCPLDPHQVTGVIPATLLQRSIHHLCQAIGMHYLIKAPPRTQLWAELYAAYLLGRDLGVLAVPTTPLPGRSGHAESPEDAFKHAMLLALCSPATLRGRELGPLSEMLTTLAPWAQLTPPRPGVHKGPMFLIGLYHQAGPRVLGGAEQHAWSSGEDEDYVELDVQPLLAEIRRRLAASMSAAPGSSPDDPRKRSGKRRQLRYLLARLGRARRRRSSRLSGRMEMEVIAGLADVHRCLTGGISRTAPAQPAWTQTQQPNTQPDVGRSLGRVHSETETPGSQGHAVPEALSNERQQEIRRAQCQALNFSSGGYCLTTRDLKRFRLRVGELAAIRDLDQARWVPAVVVWVSSDGVQLSFGVRLLAPYMQPGKVICHQGQETQVSECLFLLERPDQEPERILLSPRCLTPGVELAAEYGERTLQLTLTHEHTRTPGYAELSCTITDSEDEPDTEPLLDAPPPPPAPVGGQRRPFPRPPRRSKR
jgi:cyclic-di-GMP-binding protein